MVFSPEMMSRLNMKLPEKKQETLSIASRGVTAPTGGPLSKNKEKQKAAINKIKNMVAQESAKPPTQVQQQTVTPTSAIENLYGQMPTPKTGEQFGAKGYEFLVPSQEKQEALLGIARRAALSGYGPTGQSQAESDQLNRQANIALVKKQALDYLQKRQNPYYGIDLEGTAKLGADLFGGSPVSVTNVPDASNDLKLLAALVGQKQGYEQTQSKEASDLLGNMVRPVPTSEINLEKKEFNPNAGRGPAQKEVRGLEMQKFLEQADNAEKVYEKSLELARIIDEVGKTPKTNVARMYELSSKYKSVFADLENRVKQVEKYGAHYTGIERELGTANLPEDFMSLVGKSQVGLYDKKQTLLAFGNSAKARAERDKQLAGITYTRPGEPQFLSARAGGNKDIFSQGSLAKPPQQSGPISNTSEKAKNALNKLRTSK